MLTPTIRYVESTNTETIGSYTNEFQIAMKTFGRQIRFRIYINGTLTYGNADIFTARRFVDTTILKSAMYTFEAEIKTLDSFDNKEITDLQFGVSADGDTFYYVSFGAYNIMHDEVVQDFERRLTRITAYDGMLVSMKPYEPNVFAYPQTNYTYLSTIANHLGLTLGNSIPSGGVMGFSRTAETYTTKYTYRDIFDDFSEILGGCLTVKQGKLELLTVHNTNQTIDETSLKTMNVKEEYPQVSNVVLSRQPQEDNVSYRTIETSGSVIKLVDNMLVEGNPTEGGVADRTVYLQPLFTTYNAWGRFFCFQAETYGYILFEPCDIVTLNIIGKQNTRILWLSSEISINQGISENVSSDMPEATETDYTKTTNESKKELDTYLYVDKVAGTINARVDDVEETVGNSLVLVSSLYLMNDGETPSQDDPNWSPTYTREEGKHVWKMDVYQSTDGTITKGTPYDTTGNTGIGVEKIVNEWALSGSDEYLTADLVPHDGLYPHNGLYPSRTVWSEDTPDYEEGMYYWMRVVTYYTDGTIEYGTPVVSAELNSAWTQIQENYSNIEINSKSIDSVVGTINTVEGRFSDYYTKEEVQSSISQTASDITLQIMNSINGNAMIMHLLFDAQGVHIATLDENGNIISDYQSLFTEYGMRVMDADGNATLSAEKDTVDANNLTSHNFLRVQDDAQNTTSRFQGFYNSIHQIAQQGIFMEK